jgi:hypothetical protein
VQPFDDAFDNGQSQTGALLHHTAASNERFEKSGTVGFRNASSTILNLKDRAHPLAVNPDIDPTALRDMTDGIVDQIANHDRKHRGLAAHADGFDDCKSKVDPALCRERQQIRNDLLGAAIKRGTRGAGHAARVVARQREQLFEQMGGAAGAAPQCPQPLAAFRLKPGMIEILGLQADGGDGGAKLVGRIGDEPPLLVDQALDALQQPVDRGDERMQFVGGAVEREPLQIVGLAPVEPLRETLPAEASGG